MIATTTAYILSEVKNETSIFILVGDIATGLPSPREPYVDADRFNVSPIRSQSIWHGYPALYQAVGVGALVVALFGLLESAAISKQYYRQHRIEV